MVVILLFLFGLTFSPGLFQPSPFTTIANEIRMHPKYSVMEKFKDELTKINTNYKAWLHHKFMPATQTQYHSINTCDTRIPDILLAVSQSEETRMLFNTEDPQVQLQPSLEIFKEQFKRIVNLCFEERLIHERFEWLTITSWFKAQMTEHHEDCMASLNRSSYVQSVPQCLWKLSLIYSRSDWKVDEVAKDFAAYGSGVENVKMFLSTLNDAHNAKKEEMDTLVELCLQNELLSGQPADLKLDEAQQVLQEIMENNDKRTKLSREYLVPYLRIDKLADAYKKKVSDIFWWEPEAYYASYFTYRVDKWKAKLQERVGHLQRQDDRQHIEELKQLVEQLRDEYNRFLTKAQKIRQIFDSYWESTPRIGLDISMFRF